MKEIRVYLGLQLSGGIQSFSGWHGGRVQIAGHLVSEVGSKDWAGSWGGEGRGGVL